MTTTPQMLRAIGDHVGLCHLDGLSLVTAGHPWQVQVRPTVGVFLRWARSLAVQTVLVDHGHAGNYYLRGSGHLSGAPLDLMLVLTSTCRDFPAIAKAGIGGPLAIHDFTTALQIQGAAR